MGCCGCKSTDENKNEKKDNNIKTTIIGSTYPTEADVDKLILNDNKYDNLEETTVYEDEKPFSEIKKYGKIIDQKKIDKILSNAPKRETITLEGFEEYIKENTKNLSQKEQAYLIFCWLSYNITYDSKGLKDGTVDRTAEGSFSKGTTVCAGYARLFEHIGKSLGMDIEYIIGYSKGGGYDPEPEHFNYDDKHAWNTIILDGEKFLIDSTWGAGSTGDDDVYTPKLNPFYFLTPPDIFLLSHFPDKSEEQLMGENIIDMDVFLDKAKFTSDFFNLNFINCNCRKKVYKIKRNNKIFKFKHKSNEKIYLMTKLTKIDENAWVSKLTKKKGKGKEEKNDENKDKKKIEKCKVDMDKENSSAEPMGDIEGEEIEYSTFIQEKDNEFTVDVLFNKKGKYVIGFFAKEGNMDTYSGICEFIIYCEQDAKFEKFYPKHYGQEVFDIISPNLKSGPIEYGKEYDFKIKSRGQKFFVLQSDFEKKKDSYFKLLKNDDCFYDEKIIVHNDIVKFVYLNEETDTFITAYEFKIIKKNNNRVTYPKVFSEKYTKLYEPKTEELMLGTKINFRVKILDVQKVFIIQGESFIEMDKIGDIYVYNDMYIFDKTIKISYLNENENFVSLLNFKGIENPNISQKITYPVSFSAKKSRVLYPDYGELLKGTFIDFKCQVFDVDTLYIGQDKGHIEMDKIGKNIFELKNAYIYSKDIKICYLEQNTFYTILKYCGIDNPSMNNEEITYPKVWEHKKCRLIKPIKGNLNLGSHVDFEVKVYDTQKMNVIQDENFFNMDKKSEHTYQYKDMYIYSNKIKLTYYEPARNKNFYLFEFQGVKDPNNKNEISYPRYTNAINAKLIEPLTGILKKNSKVKFNIQTCETDILEVIVGDKWNILTKEGDNFIGEILIDADTVSVYFSNPSNDNPNNYSKLYEFKVVR